MKGCIILANGKPPLKSVINYLKENGYPKLICADGGANSAFNYRLIPNVIIGDFDSIKPAVLKYYSNKSKIVHYKRQSDTDVEKCIKYAVKERYTDVVLLAATGDRLDHSFCNLGITLKFYDKINISMIHHKSFLKVYTGKVELKTSPGETISLYGFNAGTKITSAGLKYPLIKDALQFGIKESTSNSAVGNKVLLKITGGRIFIIRDYENVKKNGLI